MIEDTCDLDGLQMINFFKPLQDTLMLARGNTRNYQNKNMMKKKFFYPSASVFLPSFNISIVNFFFFTFFWYSVESMPPGIKLFQAHM